TAEPTAEPTVEPVITPAATFTTGITEQREPTPVMLLEAREEVYVAPHESGKFNHNHVVDLECAKDYTLAIEDIEIIAGDVQTVTACVFDSGAETRIASREISISELEGGRISWTFATPDTCGGDLRLLLYAGIPGSTEGIGVVYRGVAVYEGVVDNYVDDALLVASEDKAVVSMHETGKFNNRVIKTLTADKDYTLIIDDLVIDAGVPDSIMICVFDTGASERILSYSISLEELVTNKGKHRWMFRTPETSGELQLLLYAGVPGATEGVGITCTGVRLYEGLVYADTGAPAVLAMTDELALPVKDNSDYNNSMIMALENDRDYTLIIDDIIVTAGSPAGATVCVYDAGASEWCATNEFTAAEKEANGEYRWSFHTPETSGGELQLLIYAGIAGNTKGVGIRYEDVIVYDGIVVTDIARPRMLEAKETATIQVHETSEFNNYYLVALEAGKDYTLKFDSVTIDEGNPEGIVACVFDQEGMERVLTYELGAEELYGSDYSWAFHTPDNGSDSLQLLLYPSVPGKCAGIGVTYNNVIVYEGIVMADVEMPGVVLEKDEVVVQMHESGKFNNNCVAILEPGKEYTLEIRGAAINDGAPSELVICVFEEGANERWANFTINAAELDSRTNAYRWAFKTPANSQGELKLLMYAGVPGETAGVGVTYYGVTVYDRGIYGVK
ncbi:MAG: hypothetical protein IJC56_03825, partial [Clostridia bacterium]|nr:hypothetical protein [Clostridia bacterium]